MERGGSGGGGDYIEDKDAKHVLDKIGQQVYKEKVEKDVGAEAYKEALKGDLKKAKGSDETVGTDDPCTFEYNELAGANDGKRHPCTELSGNDVERFSNTLGGQCTDSKMRRDGIGACAPYRRLHLCHHNLESIDTTSKTASDTLLAE
ncbi:hypothetical protein PFHG_05543, partial [Plasmodium falciparum HB3]